MVPRFHSWFRFGSFGSSGLLLVFWFFRISGFKFGLFGSLILRFHFWFFGFSALQASLLVLRFFSDLPASLWFFRVLSGSSGFTSGSLWFFGSFPLTLLVLRILSDLRFHFWFLRFFRIFGFLRSSGIYRFHFVFGKL
ncbi:hypothetical protein CW304_25470 [Bacillus sp. UFRGS-B20]|nr:hypothetical protein CW304_25470 [Bacillus sp. UFRGS-B20]